jgi:hypothetical protein
MRSGQLLRALLFRRGTALLLALAFVVGTAASFPYLSVITSASDLNYPLTPRGWTLIPSGTIFPLTASVIIGPEFNSCNKYSGEIAIPAQADNLRTLVRGLDIANSSAFVGYSLLDGSWPSEPWQVAIGKDMARATGLRVGQNLTVENLLVGDSATFLISGVFESEAASQLNSELLLTVSAAQEFSGLGAGHFSYVRLSNSCSSILPSASVQLSIPQVLSRFLSPAPPTVGNQNYALYGGAAPIVNGMATVGLLIVLGASTSLWFASAIFAGQLKRNVSILREQGLSNGKLLLHLVLPESLLIALTVLLSLLLSNVLLQLVGFGTPFHFVSTESPPVYQAIFLISILGSSAISLWGGLTRRDS